MDSDESDEDVQGQNGRNGVFSRKFTGKFARLRKQREAAEVKVQMNEARIKEAEEQGIKVAPLSGARGGAIKMTQEEMEEAEEAGIQMLEKEAERASQNEEARAGRLRVMRMTLTVQ